MAAYTTIDDPEAHFQVKTYTGTGSELALTLDGDTDMQPDLVWVKERSGTEKHCLVDAVRGATVMLNSNTTAADDTIAQSLKSFQSDGFTIGTDGAWNNSSDTYVAWCWKANGSGGAQTDGDIDTVRSTNTTSLFTIATYTASGTAGNTLGHGLGVKPALYIIKNRDTSPRNWRVYHHKNTSAPETEFLGLNVVNATEDDAGMTNDTAPTTSLITLGSMVELNTSGEDYVMYAWGEVQGFSKFGSYAGNGSSDGPFVYLGFRPAWLMIKCSSATSTEWRIWNNKMDTFNPADNVLDANDNGAEDSTAEDYDFCANGFKVRASGLKNNDSGETYIYMAFAEAPFVNSEEVPANAR